MFNRSSTPSPGCVLPRLVALVAPLWLLPIAPAYAADEEISKRLNKLFMDAVVAARPLFPLIATGNGLRQYDDQFTNFISDEHRAKHRAHCESYQTALREFDRAALSERDRLSYDIFAHNMRACLARLSLDLHFMPVDQAGWSLPATFPIFASGKGAHPFRNARDYDNMLKRVPGFVEWMDTAIANMRRGIARGWTQPQAIMKSMLPQLESMIVDTPQKSLFYQPIQDMPESIPEIDRARLSTAYEQMIMTQVVPAYTRLRNFVRDEYIPKARTTEGVGALPDGLRLYQFFIEANTTTTLTPDEIFAMGEREVTRIRERIDGIKARTGFRGDMKAWAQQLRASSARYATRSDVISAYETLRQKVEPQLPSFFLRLPKARYEIRAIEPYREASSAHQYWAGSGSRPGIFYVNLRGLSKEPVGVSINLFLHETVPGHHFQIALARENRDLPNFRRGGGPPAFTEGWAMYAETLGFEMGLYQDPYAEIGFFNSQLWSATNLVADVGIHAKGWTRQEAISYLNKNSLSPYFSADYERGQISVVERMIALPGYALAYRIGQLTMSDLRAQAERELGARFDLRLFHDELLKDGPMPLQILRQKIERWIASQRQ